ncbi:MAG: sigma-70 family RNA polymerase sigma factor [Oscillospiraceae bacterium]|nr:sigma-70 family RNA polymerase sigma factor [Oscillospiraceae bacterium]
MDDFIDVKGSENMNDDNIFEINNNFYEKYNPTIRAIVTNILKPANQSQDIDDCVNTVFLSLMEKLQQYNETRGSMAAFVIIIARSTALDYRRNSIRKTGELISDDKIDFLGEPLNFENEVEFDMLVEKIILENLNNQERRLYTMKYILFDPPEEITKCFNINRNAADARIHRLKKKIKHLLKKGGITL